MWKDLKTFKKWLTDYAKTQLEGTGKKTLYIGISLLFLILFADSVLLLIKKFLRVFVEIIESLMEHFLIYALQLTPRQAEMIVFWIDFFILSVFLWYFLGKFYGWLLRAWSSYLEKWRNKTQPDKLVTLFWTTLLFIAFLKILFIKFA